MRSYTITDEQAENTRMAYSIFAGIPSNHIALGVTRRIIDPENGLWVKPTNRTMIKGCGSVGCVCGWLSIHDYFVKKGLRFRRGNVVLLLHGLGDYFDDLNVMSKALFGSSFMFNGGSNGIKGKREGLARLRAHLFNAGRISAERNAELMREERDMQN